MNTSILAGFYWRDPNLDLSNPIHWLFLLLPIWLPMVLVIFVLILSALPGGTNIKQSFQPGFFRKIAGKALLGMIMRKIDDSDNAQTMKNKINQGVSVAKKVNQGVSLAKKLRTSLKENKVNDEAEKILTKQ
jgi:hypothetical protein